jgi:hypothetical protein
MLFSLIRTPEKPAKSESLFFGGRSITKPVNSGNAAAGAGVLEAGSGVPAAAGGRPAGGVPAAARVPLRELMDDRLLDALWSGRGTRQGAAAGR